MGEKLGKKLKIISLFAGCGGMDWGFVKAKYHGLGYEIVWANDFDKYACETYKKNLKHDIVCGDIWNTNLSNLPEADVVIGGFPCKDFSNLRGGTRPGFKSKRGLLYTKFVEVVSKKLPLFFVAENVKGLLSMHGGKAIEKIVEDFSKVNHVGYDVKCYPMKFADYGKKKKRERVIIIGIRNDLGLKFKFPKPTHEGKHVSVKKALKGIENVSLNNEKLKMNDSTKKKLETIPPGGNYKDLPDHGNRNWMSLIYRRLHPDEPSPTIVASGGGGTWGYHFAEPRPLTNRERAKIQTFPNSFEFVGSTTEVRRQIGNAVPPEGIKPIAQQLLKTVEKRFN